MAIALLLLVAPVALFFLARAAIALADAVLIRRYPPPGQLIAVGGHRLHLFCQGSGAPSVVIETGLGVNWSTWAPVVSDLSRSVEVCVYDRAGYGWSGSGPMPRTAAQIATELHQLLTVSKHAGRVALVAHSFGGYVARVYAGQYGASLSGVVLIDPSEHDPAEMHSLPPRPRPFSWSVSGIVDQLPPLGWNRVKRLYRGESVLFASQRELPIPYRHRAVIASSLDQLKAEKSELDSRLPSQLEANAAVIPADLTFIVVTPFYVFSPREGQPIPTTAIHRNRHRALAASAALGSQVFAEQSGHHVHIDQPDLVVRVIRDVLAQAARGHE